MSGIMSFMKLTKMYCTQKNFADQRIFIFQAFEYFISNVLAIVSNETQTDKFTEPANCIEVYL